MTTHPVRHSLVAERKRYAEQVYAGVLGKIIGVCLGRPVEGRPYQDIADRFGEVGRYVNDDLGVPLIVASAAILAGTELLPPRPRFTFAHRGPVQGFTGCPYHPGADVHGTGNGLRVRHGGSPEAATEHVSTPTFLDPAETSGSFTDAATTGTETEARLHELDWHGAPEHFEQSGVLLSSICDTRPLTLAPEVSSAKNFEADFAVTYSVSQPDALGVVTTGTREWTDHAVASRLTLSLHETAGLVARSRGHRRFYAGVFAYGDRLRLLHQRDGERHILAEAPFPYERDRPYAVELRCRGTDLALSVDGRTRLTAAAADGVRVSRLAAP